MERAAKMDPQDIYSGGDSTIGSERFYWLESLCESLTNRVPKDPQDIYSGGVILRNRANNFFMTRIDPNLQLIT